MARNIETAATIVQTAETEIDKATLALYKAWETGLVDYAESLMSANDAKATAKDTKAVIDAIERRILWAAFDYVRRTSNDPADAFALLVSQFVDVKDGENTNIRRQYAMRARDAFRTEWQDAMNKADRSKASPLSVAAKLRRDAVKTAERQNTIAKAGPIAAAIAADAIGSTPQGITNLIESGDTNAALAYSAAMEAAISTLTVKADLIAVLNRLSVADSATQRECAAIIAWAYAV